MHLSLCCARRSNPKSLIPNFSQHWDLKNILNAISPARPHKCLTYNCLCCMSELVRLQILFSRYLDRSCSPQEVAEMIALLNKAQAGDIVDPPMRQLWEQLKNDTTIHDVDWKRMYASITSSNETVTALPNRSKWWRYTAAAVLLSGLGIGIYWLTIRETKNTRPVAVNTVAPLQNQQRASASQTIHLPDGSTVILNQGSKLNYPSAFKGKSRDVYLSGEGFFDIQHHPKQPFFVHTGKVSVKVLGTAFNIKAFPSKSTIEVTVTRGKVQVLNEDKSIGIISASQQLLYAINTGTVTKTTVDTIPVIAWKPAEIFFNDITMEEVAKRLEERFAVVIAFDNPAVKHCRVSATFSEDDLPEEILAVVCAVSKSDYTISNKKIIIHGKGCN
jgi:transmembrane sensor